MIEPSKRGQPSQSALRGVGEDYQQLVELSPDAIFVEIDDQIVFANAATLEIFGADLFDQLIGHSFSKFLVLDSNLLLTERIEAMRQTGASVVVELQLLRLDRSIVNVEAAAGFLMWKGANATQIRLRRITGATQCEIQLRESSERFHQLADAMPQIVWMATPDGKIDYRNKKWFEQTGLTEAEADSKGAWNAILHPDDAPKATENWNRCIRTGERFQMEYRYKDRRTRGYRWHLGRALPVRNENDEIVRWFGTCTDIHDHKVAEIALQQAKEELANNAAQLEKLVTDRTIELEEMVRSSEALNYSIAHDLRAPLRAMMGFSHTLLDDYATKLEPAGQEYARRIAASAKRMDNLINALLAYGRLNYEELSFGFINTQELLENLLNDFEPEIKEANARITLTKPFPNVWANATVLKKVFVELIENALKFRGSGAPPRIDIWAEEEETKSLIWIRDNGIGIPAEHHERVFRVLESLHARNKYPGTGIGLAIVRRGIERMGGRIGLKPAPEQGSCFWIELPKALV